MRAIYSLVIAIAVSTVVGAGWLAWIDRPEVSGGIEGAAQWGDYWSGHFSAAGSVAAALLFVVAIFLQRDELMEQRKELALTRDEMAQARKVYEAQERHLHEQTEIAKHSAHVARIIEMIRLKATLDIEQLTLPTLTEGRGARQELITKHMYRIGRYLDELLDSEILSDEDRWQLSRALGRERNQKS